MKENTYFKIFDKFAEFFCSFCNEDKEMLQLLKNLVVLEILFFLAIVLLPVKLNFHALCNC